MHYHIHENERVDELTKSLWLGASEMSKLYLSICTLIQALQNWVRQNYWEALAV